MPAPEHTAKADKFHALCLQLLEHYVGAIEHDMNIYAESHQSPMDITFAHNDVTRVLAREQTLTPSILAGMVAASILKEIERKRKGKG